MRLSLPGAAMAARRRAERRSPAWGTWLWWLAFIGGVGLLWWALPVAR